MDSFNPQRPPFQQPPQQQPPYQQPHQAFPPQQQGGYYPPQQQNAYVSHTPVSSNNQSGTIGQFVAILMIGSIGSIGFWVLINAMMSGWNGVGRFIFFLIALAAVLGLWLSGALISGLLVDAPRWQSFGFALITGIFSFYSFGSIGVVGIVGVILVILAVMTVTQGIRLAQDDHVSFQGMALLSKALPQFFFLLSIAFGILVYGRVSTSLPENNSLPAFPQEVRSTIGTGLSDFLFSPFLSVTSATTVHELAEAIINKLASEDLKKNAFEAMFWLDQQDVQRKVAQTEAYAVRDIEQDILKSFEQTATPATSLSDLMGKYVENKMVRFLAPVTPYLPVLLGAVAFFVVRTIDVAYIVIVSFIASLIMQLLLSIGLLEKRQETRVVERLV